MDQQEHRTLYVDVDSTIWHAQKEYLKAEKELYGTQDFVNKWFEHHELVSMYGDNYSDIFRVALAPEKVHGRVLYPGCEVILCNLYHGMCGGFDLHFITHNMFAAEMKEPLRAWLTDMMHVGVEFKLTVIHQRYRKERIMQQDDSAWGLIDDVPKNLYRAKEAGYHVFCKAQPWNEGVDAPRFEDWHELPDLMPVEYDVLEVDGIADRI